MCWLQCRDGAEAQLICTATIFRVCCLVGLHFPTHTSGAGNLDSFWQWVYTSYFVQIRRLMWRLRSVSGVLREIRTCCYWILVDFHFERRFVAVQHLIFLKSSLVSYFDLSSNLQNVHFESICWTSKEQGHHYVNAMLQWCTLWNYHSSTICSSFPVLLSKKPFTESSVVKSGIEWERAIFKFSLRHFFTFTE